LGENKKYSPLPIIWPWNFEKIFINNKVSLYTQQLAQQLAQELAQELTQEMMQEMMQQQLMTNWTSSNHNQDCI
jgi:hypothetical protein